MKVLIRADAAPSQGTGHVMRCLTLAEGLIASGHEVTLWTNDSGIVWLEEMISSAGVSVRRCASDSLDLDAVRSAQPDWLVVDSYEISARQISAAREATRVFAVVDGTTRNIEADLYLDQNLGAELATWPAETHGRLLAGSPYALIRSAILTQRRAEPWRRHGVPRVIVFLGGSDPTGTVVTVSRVLATFMPGLHLDVIVNDRWRPDAERELGAFPDVTFSAPTVQLPSLLGQANVAISAAGTSAWELCVLGIPSVLLGVVDNQRESIRELCERGLAVGLDVTVTAPEQVPEEISARVRQLLESEALCQSLSERSRSVIDGFGTTRVILAMESRSRDGSGRRYPA